MATIARSFTLSRITDLSSKPQLPLFSRQNLFTRRAASATTTTTTTRTTVSCLSSSGGISDDFVSTQKIKFNLGFSVIANMLKKIEPLDNYVISKGVSDSAKDSMKQTISAMLGLLPSDNFSVSIRVSKHPLDRLLYSAIITGYTLWNVEYRMSLMRNLDVSMESLTQLDSAKEKEEIRKERKEEGSRDGVVGDCDCVEFSPQILGDLSPEALNFIQQLQSELSDVKEELNVKKQETMQIEHDRGSRNDLLDYLRSLDPDMVTELSQPSSIEVEDIINQLVHSIVRRYFKDDYTLSFMKDSVAINTESRQDGAVEFCETIGTSRDYLAKLLFWCMLLGHHLRGLENRLHLSCVVGLL